MNTSERENQLTLCILRVIASMPQGSACSQRVIAAKLDVSLGLVNHSMRQCISSGFILSEKCTHNSYTYTLTDEGASMLRELSASSVSHSLSFYRNSRRAYADLLKDLDARKPICFLGVSDLLPIAADVASAKGFSDVCFFASGADYDHEITRDLHLQSCTSLDSKANIASFVATTVHIKKFIPAINSVGLTIDSINIPNLSEITGLLELV